MRTLPCGKFQQHIFIPECAPWRVPEEGFLEVEKMPRVDVVIDLDADLNR